MPALIVTASAAGSSIFADAAIVQLWASVTTTLYSPAVASMLWAAALLFHANAYGSVPPLTLAIAVVVPPWQLIASALISAERAAGSSIVVVAVTIHPLPSVTVRL